MLSGGDAHAVELLRPATAPASIAGSSTLHTSSGVPNDFESDVAAPPVRLDLTASFERCPHCTRQFSQDAAARHVPICAGLKSRPKPPVKEVASRFTDSLGRRHKSRQGTPSANSPMNVSTPARSCRASPLPSSQAGTPSYLAGRKLNLTDECGEGSAASSVAGTSMGFLSDQWQMVQMLMKDGLEAFWDDAAILLTLDKTKGSLSFLERLEDWAKRLKIRKGALSRMLLPFNSDTNSGDQAASAEPLGSQELDGRMADEERRDLVAQAVVLRRLIRVKVADCADVEQARESLRLVEKFLMALREKAGEEQRTMTSVMREL